MRGLLVILALLLTGLALFAALWIVLPAPLYRLWQVAVGASEWSVWLGVIALVGIACAFGARALGGGWTWSIALLMGGIALVLALVPPAQAWHVARDQGVELSLRRYVVGLDVPAIEPQEITFATVSGQELRLDAYLPPDQMAATPAIVVVHGGSWSGGDKRDFPRWNAWLAQQGYAVFDVQYRLAPQPNWQTATGDVKCALGWVAQNAARYNVDPDRIGLLGRSAGGHLALLAAYTPNDPALPPSCDVPKPRVRAVVSFYGPTDLVWGYNNPANPDVIDGPGTLRRFLGGTPATALDTFRTASPITHVSADTPPTLLLHGGRDQLVGQRHAELLSDQLRAANVPYRTVYIPYGQHGFDFNFNGWSAQIVQPVVLEFLETYVK